MRQLNGATISIAAFPSGFVWTMTWRRGDGRVLKRDEIIPRSAALWQFEGAVARSFAALEAFVDDLSASV